MDEIKVGDRVTPKLSEPSMFHGKVGTVLKLMGEDKLAVVDFKLKHEGQTLPVLVVKDCLLKVKDN